MLKALGRLRHTRRWLKAAATDRLIVVDYSYRPEHRDLLSTAGGAAMAAMFGAQQTELRATLESIGRLRGSLERIPLDPGPAGQPHWNNMWFSGLDAASLYALLVERNPSVYLEIGSGHSTAFARRAIRDHGLRTRIVSIDPQPRAPIADICDTVIREPFEVVGPDQIRDLDQDAMVFLDSSHRAFQGSDVTVFFLEVLPALRPGTLWGIHDTFLPYDYPQHWVKRWYNEQYLLATYLIGGAGPDRVVLPNHYVCQDPDLSMIVDTDVLGAGALASVARQGGCFWMARDSR